MLKAISKNERELNGIVKGVNKLVKDNNKMIDELKYYIKNGKDKQIIAEAHETVQELIVQNTQALNTKITALELRNTVKENNSLGILGSFLNIKFK